MSTQTIHIENDRSLFKIEFTYFLMFVLFFLVLTGRGIYIYIAHDDLDFMVQPEFSLHSTPYSKTLSEGRWINFLWSTVAIKIPMSNIFYLFIIGYSIFCWSFSCLMTKNRWYRVIISIALFLCPNYSEMSAWPATLAPSVWIAAFVFLAALNHTKKLNLITFLSSLLLSMSYPPLGMVCFMALAYKSENLKCLFIRCIYYSLGFIAGIIVIFSLNKYFHDVFGIATEGWRHAHKIKDISSFLFNINKAISSLYNILSDYLFIIITASTLIFTGFVSSKKNTVKIIAIGIFAFLFDVALLVYSGIDITNRYLLWPWFFLVICLVHISCEKQDHDKKTNSLFILLAVIIINYGFSAWSQDANYYSRVSSYEKFVGTEIDSQELSAVITCGTPKFININILTMYVRKNYNIGVTIGNDDQCKSIATYGISNIQGQSFYKFR